MRAGGESWRRKGYQRIVTAHDESGQLSVRFGDGTTAELPVGRLPHLPAADWAAMQVDPYAISVSTAAGPIEIAWSTIRALTDQAYCARLDQIATKQSRLIGLRIHELREQRRFTLDELASRAGLDPRTVSAIEHGECEVALGTLQRILAAMGCRLQDLVVASGEPPRERPSHE